MKKLIVDISSVLWMALLAGEDKEFGRKIMHKDKPVQVNGALYGYDNAMNHLTAVMNDLEITPADMIFVIEGQLSKARRKVIYSGYKDERDSRPAEAYEEFNKAKEALARVFRNVGAQIVTQDGVEGDDVIAYLCRHLPGVKIIRSNDSDMTTLLEDPSVFIYSQKLGLTQENKYGPFPPKFVPVYKALVGDGNEYKGAYKFGEKAFLNMLVYAGNPGLAAIEGMMQRKTLHDLEDDVAEFKDFRKVIDGAQHVYESYQCALLHDEWVNTDRQPLMMELGSVQTREFVKDPRLVRFAAGELPVVVDTSWWDDVNRKEEIVKKHAVFDCELIGSERPVFLIRMRVLETREAHSFWWHIDGDMDRAYEQFKRKDLTWISFNGLHFDQPILSAAICGKHPLVLKQMAKALIEDGQRSWEMSTLFNYDTVKFDHIDLMEVSPGVRISLKTFAGRMGYPSMVDMPFHHDTDLTPDQYYIVDDYCDNDLGVTEALFNELRSEIELRTEMSLEHGIDLRSKSDAQVAEAILKKVAGITKNTEKQPSYVTYKAPPFIETESDQINDIIHQIENTDFKINFANGMVVAPDFLKEPIELGFGKYQMGVGGLHSTHDKCFYSESDEEYAQSDFDVAGYYPVTMLIAGLTPRLANGAGERFIAEYKNIYDRRIEAKRSGNKKVANALKISLNGTFGKLGSPYSAFYSPDLMLAVTITGQLNLMCLIYDLEFHPNIRVMSANTDGIAVRYPRSMRDRVLNIIKANALRTGYEYEETRYAKIAMKDVNNYIAITSDEPPVIISPKGEIIEGKGKVSVKRKGLYAETGLMKNPTMEVCSNMAIDYLKTGTMPAEAIKNYTDIRDFVAIRNITGGGIQFDHFDEVDDWVLVDDNGTKDNGWFRQAWYDAGYHPDFTSGPGTAPHEKAKQMERRKSRPKPVQIGVGGEMFGRIARWYQQKDGKLPINSVKSGNKIPKTDGAKLCMTLPAELPDDLDLDWYIRETLSILADIGVKLEVPEEIHDTIEECV